MRLVVVLVALAGCGRLEFDRVPSAVDAAPLDVPDAALGSCVEGDARLEQDGACYSRFDGPANYLTAKATCASIGGHLMTITSPRENSVLAQLVTFDAWIGFDDRAEEGVHTWITGEPTSFLSWAPGEPNDDEDPDDEDCVEAYVNEEWNDEDCTLTQPFLCERRLEALPCTEGVQRAEYGGHCYFRIAGDVVQRTAVARCAEHEAHLVTITSAEENDVVYSLVPGYGWMGLGDEPENGGHEWVTGEPLAYTNWLEGEPNDSGRPEDCVQMLFGGQWNDYACDEPSSEAVCERP